MPRRVVIGVGIASHPFHAAGNTWAFLQWVLGFRQAGWEVWMVENIPPAKCIDAQGRPCEPAASANLAHWNAVVEEFGLKDRATLFFDGHSPELPGLLRFARDAEFLFNISGHFMQREVFDAVREKVYADLDPAFTQIWAEVYQSDMHLDAHDTFVSIGRHLGKKECRAPVAGRTWLPMGVPVVLDYFTNPQPDPPGEVWTTFTHWYGYPQVEYDGAWYGNKSEEFARLVDLPKKTKERNSRSPPTFIPRTRRRNNSSRAAGGWSMRGPSTRRGSITATTSPKAGANFAWPRTAMCGPVAAGSATAASPTSPWAGPSSCRKPAGPIFIRTAKGCSPSTTRKAPARALETVAKDPARHARAARRIAEKYCSAPVVVNQLLETLGRAA